VEAESHRGWEELRVQGSPTFILPSGKRVWNPGAMRVTWGPNYQVRETPPADCPGVECFEGFRAMLDEALVAA